MNNSCYVLLALNVYFSFTCMFFFILFCSYVKNDFEIHISKTWIIFNINFVCSEYISTTWPLCIEILKKTIFLIYWLRSWYFMNIFTHEYTQNLLDQILSNNFRICRITHISPLFDEILVWDFLYGRRCFQAPCIPPAA